MFFLGEIVGWGRVDTLILFDLSLSNRSIPQSLLLFKISNHIRDRSIMRLLAFILELPVLVNTGEKEMKDNLWSNLPRSSYNLAQNLSFFLWSLQQRIAGAEGPIPARLSLMCRLCEDPLRESQGLTCRGVFRCRKGAWSRRKSSVPAARWRLITLGI